MELYPAKFYRLRIISSICAGNMRKDILSLWFTMLLMRVRLPPVPLVNCPMHTQALLSFQAPLFNTELLSALLYRRPPNRLDVLQYACKCKKTCLRAFSLASAAALLYKAVSLVCVLSDYENISQNFLCCSAAGRIWDQLGIVLVLGAASKSNAGMTILSIVAQLFSASCYLGPGQQ